MNSEYADIEPVYFRDPLTGNTFITGWDWVGEKHLPVRIYKVHDVSSEELPWPLILVADDPLYQTKVYVRADAGIIFGWLISRWLKHTIAFNEFQMRLILTCSLWGIGHISPQQIPTWGGLFDGKKFSR